jgi:hypothetical protein
MVGQPPGRTFISYSRKDGAEFVAWLRGWLDERHLSTRQDWWSQIEDALKSKALLHFILVVTLGSSVVLINTRVRSAVVPLLAVLLRTRLLPVMAHTEACRGRIGHGLAVAAAVAVALLGLWPLFQR